MRTIVIMTKCIVVVSTFLLLLIGQGEANETSMDVVTPPSQKQGGLDMATSSPPRPSSHDEVNKDSITSLYNLDYYPDPECVKVYLDQSCYVEGDILKVELSNCSPLLVNQDWVGIYYYQDEEKDDDDEENNANVDADETKKEEEDSSSNKNSHQKQLVILEDEPIVWFWACGKNQTCGKSSALTSFFLQVEKEDDNEQEKETTAIGHTTTPNLPVLKSGTYKVIVARSEENRQSSAPYKAFTISQPFQIMQPGQPCHDEETDQRQRQQRSLRIRHGDSQRF